METDRYIAPRISVRAYLRILRYFLKRSYRYWSFFPVSWTIQVINLIAQLALYFLIAIMLGETAQEYLRPYGGNYVAFVITGLAFNQYLNIALTNPQTEIANAYWNGYLEMYLLCPVSFPFFLLGTAIFSFIHTTIYALIYILCGVFLFGVTFQVGLNILWALIVLVLAVIAVSGLGLIGASTFSFLEAKSWGQNPVTWIVGMLVSLVSGMYYPIEIMPQWLQKLAYVLPHYYAYDGMRRALLGGETIVTLFPQILTLLLMCFITVPIGWYLFKMSLEKSRLDGNLSRWA